MNNILSEALRKIGVSNYNELEENEKQTFRQWEQILNQKDITSKDVYIELETLEQTLIDELVDKKSKPKDVEMHIKAQLTILRFILKIVKQRPDTIRQVEDKINSL
jgi:hypothetical protein